MNKVSQQVGRSLVRQLTVCWCFCFLYELQATSLVFADNATNDGLKSEQLDLKEQYRLIDEYLTEKLPNNEEVKSNFKKLDEWLSERFSLVKLILPKDKQEETLKSKLQPAYNQLTQVNLNAGLNVDWCYDLGVDRIEFQINITRSLPRLKSIIDKLLEEHLHECQPAIVKQARDIFASQVPKFVNELVDQIGGHVTEVLFDKIPALLLDPIFKVESTNSEDVYGQLIETIQDDGSKDWAGIMLDPKFIQRLRKLLNPTIKIPKGRYDELIVNPCQFYTRIVEETRIFDVPELIIKNVKRITIAFDQEDHIANQVFAKSFYRKWMNFKICKEIILKNADKFKTDRKMAAEALESTTKQKPSNE